ncbi:MAG: hypothetical protein KDJ74_12175 [Notoacmeibacter sp.]|nr:hypothetical protein [Notoacmeibacter sp.]
MAGLFFNRFSYPVWKSKMIQLVRLFAFCILLLLPQAAAAGPAETLKSWYAMLQAGSDMRIAALLADNAVIVLEDIGVEQSKDEFVESLDEWKDAIKGGSVEWKMEKQSGDSATALVCYRFAEAPMTVREVFSFSGDLISRSVQTQVADNCDGF